MRRLLRLLRDLFDLPLSSTEAWWKLLGAAGTEPPPRLISAEDRRLSCSVPSAGAGIGRRSHSIRRLLRDLFDLPLSSTEAWRKLLGAAVVHQNVGQRNLKN
jgi:hypothetical protein